MFVVIVVAKGMFARSSASVIFKAQSLGMTTGEYVYFILATQPDELLPWKTESASDAENQEAKAAFKQVFVVSFDG